MARLYCGTSGWNYPHWRGVFYPRELAQANWLSYYAEHFDTVEINNSFYRLPEKETFQHWRDSTPAGFTFAVKASRYLTHIKRLKEPEEPQERLLTHASGLGDKLGPILYQLPPNLPLDSPRLEYFLRLLSPEQRSVFEFRNESWQCEEVWSMLEKYSAAYCIMDSPGLPLHLKSTAPFSYIRMHSGGEETEGNYTDEHIREWADRVAELGKRGDVYVYFNNDNRGFAVENALALRKANVLL